MRSFRSIVFNLTLILSFIFSGTAYSDNHNIYEILDLIKKDLKTLERAVYSGSIEIESNQNNQSLSNIDNNSEDVLTRHLLKLSEVEKQFRELTNKFEEINFKLDKLSNRVSKLQSDNQIRFQDIENDLSSVNVVEGNQQLSSAPKIKKQILPGSSQPQDLGTISYKDMETSEENQQIQSVDTTASIVENISSREKILPIDLTPKTI